MRRSCACRHTQTWAKRLWRIARPKCKPCVPLLQRIVGFLQRQGAGQNARCTLHRHLGLRKSWLPVCRDPRPGVGNALDKSLVAPLRFRNEQVRLGVEIRHVEFGRGVVGFVLQDRLLEFGGRAGEGQASGADLHPNFAHNRLYLQEGTRSEIGSIFATDCKNAMIVAGPEADCGLDAGIAILGAHPDEQMRHARATGLKMCEKG